MSTSSRSKAVAKQNSAYDTRNKDTTTHNTKLSKENSIRKLNTSKSNDISDLINMGKYLSHRNIETQENYNIYINEIMAKYQTDNLNKEKDSESNVFDISMIEELDIKNGLKNNHNSISNIYHGTSENSMLKVEIKSVDYKNPFESFKVLKKNKIIYDNISSSFFERQKLFYGQALEKINHYMNLKVKMPKIKVTSVMPKILDSVSTVSNTIIPTDESSQSAKKKKKNHKDATDNSKAQSQYMVNYDNLRLYASYMYANKNFPEGREQFAFNYNLSDVVLYGGIVSNKNNNVWSLDPGRYIVKISNPRMEQTHF